MEIPTTSLTLGMHHCSKSNQLTLLKLGVMTDRKNLSTFRGDSVLHHFTTSSPLRNGEFLGNLLEFPVQPRADFHDTRRNDCRRQAKTRSPASAGIANRPLVFATRTKLSGHNIEYLCLNLFTLRRFNNNESSGGRQIRFCPY